MRQNGQGALEYLLLIGGAVLVAGVVIVLLIGTTAQAYTPTAPRQSQSRILTGRAHRQRQ